MDCVFCKIIRGEIPAQKIYEDDAMVAFLDNRPISPAHTLLVPKAHKENIFDIDERLYSRLFLAARKLAPILRDAAGAKRTGMIVEGFLIPHAHIHLVPLKRGGGLSFSNARPADEGELAAMAGKIAAQTRKMI